MAQKFTSLADAAAQLGISKDRLSQLREAGKVRAYRDGASWKFRSEDIDKLTEEGIPRIDASASDLALDLDDDDAGDRLSAAPASDLDLDEMDEPAVAGSEDEGSDAQSIDLDEGGISLSDSILLDEADLGTPPGRPPSTIIGRAELDADLDLTPPDQSKAAPSKAKSPSGSENLPAPADDLELDLPSPSDDFAGLAEVEVDLEAESSRVLSSKDLAKAKAAAAKKKAAESSELELAPSDSDAGHATSDVGLGGEAASGAGLTGLSALELEDEDDEVLGEGSDVTLSGESSGINIISPSDSGLALDEVALDLSGSTPMGSSLDLGAVASTEYVASADSKIGEDFQLTPLGEEGADEEKDSSQVIALDELSEETAGTPFTATGDESELGEDFGMGLAPGAVVVADATAETPFSLWNVLGLASCLVLLSLCGMMMFDLLRNMWSWEHGVSGLNSSLLEVLNPFL